MAIRKHIAVFVAFAMVMASMFIGTVLAKAITVNPPTNVKVESVRGEGIKVSWTVPADNWGYSYEIYRTDYASSDYGKALNVVTGSSSSSYFDKTVEHGKIYKYTVKSRDNNLNTSAFAYGSPSVQANLSPGTIPTPGTATANGTSVTLTWSSPAYNVKIAQGPFSFNGFYNVLNTSDGGKVLVNSTSGTSYTLTGLAANTKYKFGICYTNAYGDFYYALFDEVTTGAASSGSGSESGGSGSESGGSGGSGSGTLTAPVWSNYSVGASSTMPGEVRFYITNNIYDNVYVQVKKDGKQVINQQVTGYNGLTKYLPMRYDKKTKIEYRLYFKSGTKTAYTGWKSVSVASKKLKKPSLSVTKISSKKAGLKWSHVSGATGYKIYKGSKCVKTLKASKTKYIYTKKGAGKAKYRVQAIIKTGGMTKAAKGPKSAARKGKSNQKTFAQSKSLDSVKYGLAPYRITKVSLKGNTYTITGYVVNHRMFKLIKYQKLRIVLYCDGKKVGQKTFRNLKVNCKDNGVKKLTVKVRGKGGVDLRNNPGQTYHAEWTPYWETVGAKPF